MSILHFFLATGRCHVRIDVCDFAPRSSIQLVERNAMISCHVSHSPDDEGHAMKITLTKVYPIDARPCYGHRTESDDKLQWLSLPGARFRFDGTESDEIGMRKLYVFSQVNRSREQA
jgi:hypothetical protein